jgi:sulfate adenylyltransferase subunit 2
VTSNAKTIDEIVDELKITDVEEREGRSQDKESEQVMRRLRSLGYM